MGRRVEFVVGGIQKGGTTALWEYLRRDFQVSLANTKEAHFFDQDSLDWVTPDYEIYHSMFDPENRAPRGEATPIYIYWPNSLERIATYNPDMRLVFVFRDPVERAWSHWKMEIQRDFDDVPFSWAIREGRTRVANDPETPGYHRVYSYVERGFYGAQLDRALSIFPKNQILNLRSEDLDERPNETLNLVSAHLGLPPLEHDVQPLRANVGQSSVGELSMPAEDTALLSDLYRQDMQKFGALSGLDVTHWAPSSANSMRSALCFPNFDQH